MIYEKPGTGIDIDGKSFIVGMSVEATGLSEYLGLMGYITEIRTDSDMDTENDGPDIYCSFDTPENEEDVNSLEYRFSELYDELKTIDDIALDMVIMAPDMIQAA